MWLRRHKPDPELTADADRRLAEATEVRKDAQETRHRTAFIATTSEQLIEHNGLAAIIRDGLLKGRNGGDAALHS